MARYQVVIGRSEYIDLPGIVSQIPAKVDTGAYRSAIHCESIKRVKRNGADVLKVKLLGHTCSPVTYDLEFDEFEEVTVTNSFGHDEKRYEVMMRAKLGPKVFKTSFTLADRSGTLFPVLIGRKMLKGRCLVDVRQAGVDRVKLKKEFNVKAPLDEEDME